MGLGDLDRRGEEKREPGAHSTIGKCGALRDSRPPTGDSECAGHSLAHDPRLDEGWEWIVASKSWFCVLRPPCACQICVSVIWAV